MFERFTDRARRVLVLAQEEARLLNHSFIGTEHILLGLIHEDDGLAAKALASLDISLQDVREQIENTMGPVGAAPAGTSPFTPRAKKVLELALREALQLGHNYIGTEHMLLGLVREGEGVAVQVLRSLGADAPAVRETVLEMLARTPAPGQFDTRAIGQDVRGREWPRHPTKLIPGPSQRLGADGIEFRVIGVILFAEGTRVLWRISGIPSALAELLHDQTTERPSLQGENSVAYVMVTDDLETHYVSGGSTMEMQSAEECAGSSFFTPAVTIAASRLRVKWQGQILEVDLKSAT